MTKEIWIIRRPGTGPGPGTSGPVSGRLPDRQDFEVSDLGRILMLHLPHYIRAPLVGFETVPKRDAGERGRRFLLRRATRNMPGDRGLRLHEAHLFQDLDFSEYPELADYIRAFRSALTRNSPVMAELGRQEASSLERLNGLYPGFDGSVQTLALSGGPVEQKLYVEEHYGRPVEILVDPGGSYDSNLTFRLDHRLFRARPVAPVYRAEAAVVDGARASVSLYDGKKRLLRTEHGDIVDRLFLLQHAIELEPALAEALADCLAGRAAPERLTIKSFHVGQTLSQVAAPLSLEREFVRLAIGATDRRRILRELRGQVVLCILSYSSGLVENDRRTHNVGAVLHNVDGIRPIEEDFPELARSLRSRATSSELGAYYLFSEFHSSTPGADEAAVARPGEGDDG